MIICNALDVRRLAEAEEARFIVTVNSILTSVIDRRSLSREFPWAVQLWGEELAPLDYRRDRCLVSCSQTLNNGLAYAYANAAIDAYQTFLEEFGETAIPEVFNFILRLGRHSDYYTDRMRSRYSIPSNVPPLEVRRSLIRAYEQGEVWQDKPSPFTEENPWQIQLSYPKTSAKTKVAAHSHLQ
ncbi:MAG: hypothetical protein R6U67_08430 [Sodalinema sp.]|uniref:hypothetical protein n=1 Tax=Sodalinema sp. TaxID=3080550 RepID=UPI00396F70D4